MLNVQQHHPRPLLFRPGQYFGYNSTVTQPTFNFDPDPSRNRNTTLYFPASQPPSLPSHNTTLYFPPSKPSTSEISQDIGEDSTPTSSRGKNWSDQETRFLLDLWRDQYPVSKKRNAVIWDTISKDLNKQLKEHGINSFRSGPQCKARIKALEDSYKKVKDHNNRSGNDDKTCEYYEELNEVLGCKPNITPKSTVNCGLSDDDDSPVSELDGSGVFESPDFPDDGEINSLSARKIKGKRPAKGKQPASAKKKRAQKDEEESSDLFEFLAVSQEKDHEFFGKLAEKEAERELKSQKLMFDAIKEVAKIFKDS